MDGGRRNGQAKSDVDTGSRIQISVCSTVAGVHRGLYNYTRQALIKVTSRLPPTLSFC